MSEDLAPGVSPAGRPGRLAAALLGLQALTLLGFAVFYLAQLARGDGGDVTRVFMSAVVILVFAAALFLVARALWQGASWARSATMVWQLLLLPVGVSLVQSGQPLIGVAVLVMAVLTLGGLALDGRPAR